MVSLLAAAILSGPSGFIKTTTEKSGIFSLQTASHHLTAPGKPDVWLVGVAHIGAKAYYAGIQKLLNAQDEVLFEGVKPKASETKPKTPPAKPGTPIYKVLSDALGLDFQLTDIDYKHKNWIDSDLSMDELDKLNTKESGGKPNSFLTIEKLMDPNSPDAQAFAGAIHSMTPGMLEGLKLGMIKTLSTIDPNAALFDPATTEVLLKARNESVENYFGKALANNPAPKSIAIFYGALHQDSLEHTLISKYGYKVKESKWFTAATADTKKIDGQGQMILNLIEQTYGPKTGTAAK